MKYGISFNCTLSLRSRWRGRAFSTRGSGVCWRRGRKMDKKGEGVFHGEGPSKPLYTCDLTSVGSTGLRPHQLTVSNVFYVKKGLQPGKRKREREKERESTFLKPDRPATHCLPPSLPSLQPLPARKLRTCQDPLNGGEGGDEKGRGGGAFAFPTWGPRTWRTKGV